MKNVDILFQTSRSLLELKEDLKDINEVKENAFRVFENRYGLQKMNEFGNDYWKKLCDWNVDDCTHRRFGNLKLQDWE